MQNAPIARDVSPSPSFRERQRTIKAHSLVIPPSAGQVLNAQSQQVVQQSSPTLGPSHVPRRTPPPGSRISPVAAKAPTGNTRDRSPERRTSSPLIHSHPQSHIPPFASSSSQPLPNVLAIQPRPVNRVQPPVFLSQFQTTDEKAHILSQFQTSDERWAVTEQLMAEIERADKELQGSLQGISGVAYAGGAGGVQFSHSVPATRTSPKDLEGAKRARDKDKDVQATRESPNHWERGSSTAALTEPQGRSQDRTPEHRGSPQYQGSVNINSTTADRPQVYSHISADSYQPVQPTAVPTLPRRATITNGSDLGVARVTPPGPITSQSPAAQPTSTRPPGRSLPVQEEPEEDIDHSLPHNEPGYHDSKHPSPGPLPDIHQDAHASRFDGRRTNGSHQADDDDDEQTLNEDHEDHEKSDDDDSSGFTPRSPSTNLPDRPRDIQYPPQNGQYVPQVAQYSQSLIDNQKTIRPKHRGGATDQLGIRSFDPAMFTNAVNSLRGPLEASNQRTQSSRTNQPIPEDSADRHEQTYDQIGHAYFGNRVDSVPPGSISHSLPPHLPSHLEPFQHFIDDPASYLHLLQSPGTRPMAPVPPTPQTHTAAPSPAPGISSIPSEFGSRQIGSPYPYPFTHIRRNAMPAMQNTAPSSIDPNSPAVIREQLALQMQIYALNNGIGAMSDSTLSPSSTPFPGPSYNPWAFIQHSAPRPGDSTMSMRSSPSHEPIPMPSSQYPRGRGIRRKGESTNLRAQPSGAARRLRLPPRVESTQPRDTSPETSSGEETAGEERYEDQLAQVEESWANGNAVEVEGDEGEWVDENEDDVDDDLLQLEYHPSYVGRIEKRRRRWETRWDALAQAFQALDRETDTTMILLAAPSHSTKLHSLTSRSIRRDSRLLRSKAVTNIRASFHHLANQRKASRPQKISLIDQLSSVRSNTSVDGSQAEGDLRQALEAALGSLGALGAIYDQREARWREEMARINEDREHVELLLQQALGPGFTSTQGGPTT
ncbi:hypothetical protein NLI96_g10072 [Meripilus lineatus]|uniref:Uncharacterized protein n=1 Tax=Meripilus lineatus TaxID=2056292 RepID=A0AAD5UUF4_9APHY|nr:hypothetical protein NLI96_g10072 [Physisporinus lineatus]